jgi:hypothetical protein
LDRRFGVIEGCDAFGGQWKCDHGFGLESGDVESSECGVYMWRMCESVLTVKVLVACATHMRLVLEADGTGLNSGSAGAVECGLSLLS